ncbi:MAG: hypothetical protein AMXMBFR13_16730 [Phycisphaerae bacterium]
MRLFHFVGAMAVVSMAGALQARADLPLKSIPDISAALIDVSYNAATDVFQASGRSVQLKDAGGTHVIGAPRPFQIDAIIDENGVLGAGTLTISGSVLGLGPSLLTGSLTGLSYDAGGGDLFRFEFDVTGGDLALASHYGPAGSPVVVLLDANFTSSPFNGTFAASFNNNGGVAGFGGGVADVGVPVPAPGAAGLALIGMTAIGWIKRRFV